MNKLLLLFGFLFLSFNDFSQDIIFRTDGTKEEVKVTLVGDREIQYKKYNNPDGPLYSVNKNEIVLITYENGDFDLITAPKNEKVQAKIELTQNFTKNILNYHAMDVFYGDITLSYERIIGSGIVGIQVPVGFGWAYSFDYYNANDEWVKNLFYSGVGVNFYPGGQGKWRYFVGPKVLVGYGKQSYWDYVYDENGNWLYDEEMETEGIYMKYTVDNGIRFTPVKNFSVAAVVSFGLRYFPEASYYNNTVMPTGHFGFNVSYRF
jgi:hypothetical protein